MGTPFRNILITGGLGFIGSHVVEHFSKKYLHNIVVLDSETYASNQKFKSELLYNPEFKGVKYYKGDIRDEKLVNAIFQINQIDSVIHLAAESHVDNSISNPNVFAEVNVLGTMNLLNHAAKYWTGEKGHGKKSLFYHVSTDEVYGALGEEGYFFEDTPYDPKSPYSASKAASDHMVRAYHNTYKIPYVISNCSNNYGERQHVEKLIPKTISNILNGKPIPVYGMGENVRDWLYVKDHVDAIDTIFHGKEINVTYNIGGDNEMSNIDLVRKLIDMVDSGKQVEIQFVEDRKGHDFRYAVAHDKLTDYYGWKPKTDFEIGLMNTINYYKNLNKTF